MAPNPERVDGLAALFVRLWNPIQLNRTILDGRPAWQPDGDEQALIASATPQEVAAAMGLYRALVDAAGGTLDA